MAFPRGRLEGCGRGGLGVGFFCRKVGQGNQGQSQADQRGVLPATASVGPMSPGRSRAAPPAKKVAMKSPLRRLR